VTGHRRVVDRSASRLVANPSLGAGVVVWVRQVLGESSLWWQRVAGGAQHRIASTGSTDVLWWTTAVAGHHVWVTRWDVAAARSRLVRLGFRG